MIALEGHVHTDDCVRRAARYAMTYILTEDQGSREALLEQFRATPGVTAVDADLLSEILRPLSESIPRRPEPAGISDPGNDGASGRQRDAGFRSLAEERGSEWSERASPPTTDTVPSIPPTPPRPSFFEPIDHCIVCGSADLRLFSEDEIWECLTCGTGGGGANFWKSPASKDPHEFCVHPKEMTR